MDQPNVTFYRWEDIPRKTRNDERRLVTGDHDAAASTSRGGIVRGINTRTNNSPISWKAACVLDRRRRESQQIDVMAGGSAFPR